jgi:hypothetical protein
MQIFVSVTLVVIDVSGGVRYKQQAQSSQPLFAAPSPNHGFFEPQLASSFPKDREQK